VPVPPLPIRFGDAVLHVPDGDRHVEWDFALHSLFSPCGKTEYVECWYRGHTFNVSSVAQVVSLHSGHPCTDVFVRKALRSAQLVVFVDSSSTPERLERVESAADCLAKLLSLAHCRLRVAVKYLVQLRNHPPDDEQQGKHGNALACRVMSVFAHRLRSIQVPSQTRIAVALHV
jgi:hypothetical protein